MLYAFSTSLNTRRHNKLKNLNKISIKLVLKSRKEYFNDLVVYIATLLNE